MPTCSSSSPENRTLSAFRKPGDISLFLFLTLRTTRFRSIKGPTLIDQKTFYLSVKTQVKSHTFNRTFFDHRRLKNCCLYLCFNLKSHHLTFPNYLFNLEFPTKLQAEGLKLSGPLLVSKALICKLGNGTAPHSYQPGQCAAWEGGPHFCAERKKLSRQMQPYARVHSSKEVWAGFQQAPLSGIFTQYTICAAVYCSPKHKTCFND